jgi:hypothetical protein
VNPAKSAVPAYLSRLAGGAPAAAPRLQPPRPLFPPAADAVTGLGPEALPAGFARRAGPVHPGPSHPVGLPGSRVDGQPRQGAGHPGWVGPSSAVDSPAGPLGDRTSRGPSGTQVPGGEGLDRLPAVAPPAFARAAQGLPSGVARSAATQTAPEPAAPASATPATATPRTAALAVGPDDPHPWDAAPLAPPSGTAVSVTPRLTPPDPELTSPGLPPVTAAAAQPAVSTRPDMGPAPTLLPAGSAAPAGISALMSPVPAAPAPALVPPKRVPSDLEMSHHPAVGRPEPLNGSASSARVSIGTIEVIVEAPAPPPSPAPAPHPQAAPAGAGADAAWQAARGAARRCFGAGQS